MTTVTRADIAETICTEIGLSRKDAGDILDMVIDEIKGELIAGRDVKISSFGSFLLKRKNAPHRPQSENWRRSGNYAAYGYIFPSVAEFEDGCKQIRCRIADKFGVDKM